jgi:glycosyltransferase involved in cell wall biosynthesis
MLKSNVKVSIIIPLYNVEQYLKDCLDSVISQTLRDIEIICVNDGSTDGSLKILQSYSVQDPRIIVINRINRGISTARNMGMVSAKGEYILFVDSDDFIDVNYCEKLYNKAKSCNYDMVFSARYDYYREANKIRNVWAYNTDSVNINEDNITEHLINAYKYVVVVWGRIIKSSVLKNNHIIFFQDIRCGEDLPFTMLNFIYSSNIAFVEDVHYYYRHDNCGLTSNVDNMVSGMLNGLKRLKGDLVAREIPKDVVVSSVYIPTADILIGYFDKWNTGLFSRLSLKTLKEIYPKIKKECENVFHFDEIIFLNKTKIFKLKYRFFVFSLKHNLYWMPKLVRVTRNILRLFSIR